VTEETPEMAGTWDADLGMLYRVVGPSNDYEYAYSDDQRTIRPDTQWMSREEMESQRGGA
jgi:hypothetical protein